jgi:hypothetical protein
MTIRRRLYTFIGLAGLVTGCSSHSNDLNGTWAGNQVMTNSATLVDNVTLNGENSAISGNFVANTSQGVVVYQGSITGTYAKPTFQFTVTVPQGSVVNEPGCSLSLLGSGTYVNNGGGYTNASKSIAGTVTVTPSGNCSMGQNSTVDTFSWAQ